MGKKISDILLIIAFFPIAIIFFIYKLLIKKISKIQLNNYLSNITIEKIDNLNGNEFEEFLYYLFTSYGFKVNKTKKSHDYGADLIINLNNHLITIQCKLYNNHSVGNSAVQEIYTAKNYYQANMGIVITNSNFSKPAILLAEKSNIILWDRKFLIKLLNLNKYEIKQLKKFLINQIIKNKKISLNYNQFKLSFSNN